MTTVYSVIGEHTEDPAQLLALGADGHHYVLFLTEGTVSLTEPDDRWHIDPEKRSLDDVKLDVMP